MDSKSKHAGLDAWLSAADELLREQFQHSISPSTVTLEPGEQRKHSATLREIEGSLEAVLERLLLDPGRWILILEHGAIRGRYVQFLAFEDGSLVAETVSNQFLPDDFRWSSEAEAALRNLGWSDPEAPRNPNWFIVCDTRSPAITEISALVVATLRQVLSLGERDRVVVELLSSPRRGRTPASEVPLAEAPVVRSTIR